MFDAVARVYIKNKQKTLIFKCALTIAVKDVVGSKQHKKMLTVDLPMLRCIEGRNKCGNGVYVMLL